MSVDRAVPIKKVYELLKEHGEKCIEFSEIGYQNLGGTNVFVNLRDPNNSSNSIRLTMVKLDPSTPLVPIFNIQNFEERTKKFPDSNGLSVKLCCKLNTDNTEIIDPTIVLEMFENAVIKAMIEKIRSILTIMENQKKANDKTFFAKLVASLFKIKEKGKEQPFSGLKNLTIDFIKNDEFMFGLFKKRQVTREHNDELKRDKVYIPRVEIEIKVQKKVTDKANVAETQDFVKFTALSEIVENANGRSFNTLNDVNEHNIHEQFFRNAKLSGLLNIGTFTFSEKGGNHIKFYANHLIIINKGDLNSSNDDIDIEEVFSVNDFSAEKSSERSIQKTPNLSTYMESIKKQNEEEKKEVSKKNENVTETTKEEKTNSQNEDKKDEDESDDESNDESENDESENDESENDESNDESEDEDEKKKQLEKEKLEKEKLEKEKLEKEKLEKEKLEKEKLEKEKKTKKSKKTEKDNSEKELEKELEKEPEKKIEKEDKSKSTDKKKKTKST